MKDSDKNQLIGVVIGVLLCCAGFWAFTTVTRLADERDHRHIRIGARAQFVKDSIALAKELPEHDRRISRQYTEESDPQLAPGTQTMLGDDGAYHGRPAGETYADAMEDKADAVRDSADVSGAY